MKSYTLAELAEKTASKLIGDSSYTISGVDTLEEAVETDASFLANQRYLAAMKHSKAGVICIDPNTPLIEGRNYLISDYPSRAFQTIAELILLTEQKGSGFAGIHPTAVIHESVCLGANVTIAPYAVIDRGVKIGSNTYIGPGVSIGYEVQLGSDCYIHPSCVIRERSILKNRVILQPGAVIGSCGFGYASDQTGQFKKLEQLGIVVLEDDVEIGANTTIDRSRFKATIIRRGTKIDNLVQIAHNVEVGEQNMIAAQTGIAGSAKTGKQVMLGGQVGIVGHVVLDDQVLVATRGGVSKSLKAGKYRGSPAIPISDFHRQEVYVRKLEEYVQRLKALEEKIGI